MPVSSPTETFFAIEHKKKRSLEKKENDRVLIGEDMLRCSLLPHGNQSEHITTDMHLSTNGNHRENPFFLCQDRLSTESAH